jgi:hypothetical protein
MRFSNEYLDDLVDEWHELPEYEIISLKEFIMKETGLSDGAVLQWLVVGGDMEAR